VIGAAIQRASLSTGVDFGYLVGQANIESGLNPNAQSVGSTAKGLYQFIEQTWLATVKKHGAGNGLGWASSAITRHSNGRYEVTDPATRQAILDLRKDPTSAAAMAAEFASDNRDYLEAKLGRPMQSVDLYMAHFLGAGGASKFLSAYDSNPRAPAAAILPKAARANHAIFYHRDGTPRTVAEIRDQFERKIAKAQINPPVPAQPEQQQPLATVNQIASMNRPIPTPSQEYARLAYSMLAKLGS
jgi:hypothetical protein